VSTSISCSSEITSIIERVAKLIDSRSDVEIANALGVSRQVLSGWKKRGTVPYEKLCAFAEKHDVSLDYLLLGKKNEAIQGDNAIDTETLSKTIELIQKIKLSKKIVLSPDKEAKAITLLYRLFQSEQGVKEETVVEFMEMLAS